VGLLKITEKFKVFVNNEQIQWNVAVFRAL